MAGWYFVVTLGVHMQVLPHAQLQSHESGCVQEVHTQIPPVRLPKSHMMEYRKD